MKPWPQRRPTGTMPHMPGLLAALKLLMLMRDSGYRWPLKPGLPPRPLSS